MLKSGIQWLGFLDSTTAQLLLSYCSATAQSVFTTACLLLAGLYNYSVTVFETIASPLLHATDFVAVSQLH